MSGLLQQQQPPMAQPAPPMAQPQQPQQQAPQQPGQTAGSKMNDDEHFGRVVTSALKALYAPGSIKQIRAAVEKPGWEQQIAEMIVVLLMTIDHEVKYQIPKKLMVPMAYYIAMDLTKWLFENGGVEVSKDSVMQIMKMLPPMLANEYKMLDSKLARSKSGMAAAKGVQR